jgi:hypothetical protein
MGKVSNLLSLGGFRFRLRLVRLGVVTLLLELAFLGFGDESCVFGIVEFRCIRCGSFVALLGYLEREFRVLCDGRSRFGS